MESKSKDISGSSNASKMPTFREFAAEMTGDSSVLSETMAEVAHELYELRLESLRAMEDIDPKEDTARKKRKKRRKRSLSADDYVTYSIDKNLPRPVRKFLLRLQKHLKEPENAMDRPEDKGSPSNIPLHLLIPSSPRKQLHTPTVELHTSQNTDCEEGALSDEFNPTLTPVYRQFPNTTIPHARTTNLRRFDSAESLTATGSGHKLAPITEQSHRVFDIFTEVQLLRQRGTVSQPNSGFKALGSPPTPRSPPGDFSASAFSSPQFERKKTTLAMSLSLPSNASLLERRLRKESEQSPTDGAQAHAAAGKSQHSKGKVLLPPLIGVSPATKASRTDSDSPLVIAKHSET